MMDYSLNSHHVHQLAIHILSQLPLEAPGPKVQVSDILNVLLFAAASRASINQACQQLEGAPAGATILGELARQLDSLDELQRWLNRLLAELLPKGLGSKGRRIAMDLVRVPYHGGVPPRHQGEVCRSKATQGTTHFFTYATAYVVLRGRRYTLAICRVRKGEKMVQVVQRLMRRLKTLGVRVSLLLLDRGFYSVRVLRYLMRRQQPFIMAATRRGKRAEVEGGPTGTQALAQCKSRCWVRYTLKSPHEGKVNFDLAVVCRNLNGKWHRHEREALLYTTWGVRYRSLDWIKGTYRGRFGVESSYRQLHQARIRTSTRNPVLRLLFVGVALILRNMWVWLHAEVIAGPRQGARVLKLPCLRLQRLLFWLVFGVADHYRPLREIPIPRDLHKVCERFGVTFNY
jgi:hypothetical protein